jgi:hypothetical protein
MTLSFLLAQRQALLRQARLAHLAHAYDRLDDFARRVARARLRGEVHLQSTSPDSGDFSAALTALSGSQSVIEEHFTEDDIIDLVTVIGEVTGRTEVDLSFPIEELGPRFVAPLRQQLEQAGVSLDPHEEPAPKASHERSGEPSRPENRG